MSIIQEARASARLDGETLAVEPLPTVALSLWAPWAWAILFGGKTVENRSLSFPRHHLGEFWIHASLWPGQGRKPLTQNRLHDLLEQWELVRATYERAGVTREQLPPTTLGTLDAMRGKIVGRATVTGYIEQSESPWYVPESLGIVVSDPVALARPIAVGGALGWWRVPEATLAELGRPESAKETEES